jgi:death-on-curing protein
VSVRYLALDDYVAIAVAVTGQEVATLVNATNTDLADSALHAPSASFGGEEFYPDFVDKAAVLVVRLAKNHPLPDGNKRAAWASLRVFLEVNGWKFDPYPSVDDAEAAVLAIAAGDWDETTTAKWLRPILHHLGL